MYSGVIIWVADGYATRHNWIKFTTRSFVKEGIKYGFVTDAAKVLVQLVCRVDLICQYNPSFDGVDLSRTVQLPEQRPTYLMVNWEALGWKNILPPTSSWPEIPGVIDVTTTFSTGINLKYVHCRRQAGVTIRFPGYVPLYPDQPEPVFTKVCIGWHITIFLKKYQRYKQQDVRKKFSGCCPAVWIYNDRL